MLKDTKFSGVCIYALCGFVYS